MFCSELEDLCKMLPIIIILMIVNNIIFNKKSRPREV